MPLSSLPVEILAIIIDEIPDPFDVLNLARTCKYLHKTAHRRLEKQLDLREIYKCVCIKINSDDDCDGKIDECHDYFMHPIEAMVELREDPDAAFHVEELHYHDHLYSMTMGQNNILLLEKYNSSLRLPGFLDLESLMEESRVDGAEPDLFLFDLLLLLPNLKRLELYLYGQPVTQSEAFTSEFAKAMSRPTTASKAEPFQKLNSITIHDRGYDYYDYPYLDLATLPGIKSFYGSYINRLPRTTDIPKSLCPAKTVIIGSGSSKILDMFKGTRNLTFYLKPPYDPTAEWDLGEFIRALEYRVAETLEELSICREDETDFPEFPIKSLLRFPNLRKVELAISDTIARSRVSDTEPDLDDIPMLIDILPPSIRHIKLTVDCSYLAAGEFFREFDILQPKLLPNLETIQLDNPVAEDSIGDILKPWLITS